MSVEKKRSKQFVLELGARKNLLVIESYTTWIQSCPGHLFVFINNNLKEV